MKKTIMAMIVLVTALGGTCAFAEGVAVGTDTVGGDKRIVVGATFGMGMALIAGDYETLLAARDSYGSGAEDYIDTRPKLSLSFNLFLDFYITPMMAIEAGVGFIGKGGKTEIDVNVPGFNVEVTGWDKVTYFEIPIAFKLNIKGFQASIGIGMWIAVKGKSKWEDGDDTQTHTWNDDDWDWVRRFNVGPRIFLGYAIPVGPIYIVPGVTWMMHMINDVDNEEIQDDRPAFPDADEIQVRSMNIMFNVGVEYGF